MAEKNNTEKTENKKECVNDIEDLNSELEELAELFRRELEKAASEADMNETEEFEEESDEEEIAEDESVAEEERKCVTNLPFEFTGVFALVAVLVAMIMAVVSFSDCSEGYSITSRARKLASENKLKSAVQVYDEGIAFFEERNVEPKNLYLESAELVFQTITDGSSMDDVVNRIGKALDDVKYTLPYKDSLETRKETIVIYGTMQAVNSVVQNEKYSGFTELNDDVYNQVMAEINSLTELKITVKSIDGKTSEDIPANEAVIRFWQYLLASAAGRQDDAEKYLEKSYQLKPEYLWLHGEEISYIKMKKGDFDGAKMIAEKLIEVNVEASSGYYLYSYALRMSGDTVGAIEWAQKGLEYNPNDVELLRYKAAAHITMGDYASAKKCIDKAMLSGESAFLYYTAIVVENELGNTATVNQLLSTIESKNLTLPEKMSKYLDGTVTAKKLFTEGSGDVI